LIATGKHPIKDTKVVILDCFLSIVKVVAATRFDELDDIIGKRVDDEGNERVIEI